MTSWRRMAAVLPFVAVAARPQDRLEELRERDQARIARRAPVAEAARGTRDLGIVKPSRIESALTLVFVPVGFSDLPGEENPAVTGSLADYAAANSGGVLKLEIRVAPTVRLDGTRRETAALWFQSEGEARWVRKILDRVSLGPNEAVCLAYAGEMERSPTSMLWPHTSLSPEEGGARRYYVAPQAGPVAAAAHCHEFMHLFGLKDKYDRREKHCILAYGYERLPVCASCRAALGWAQVSEIGPGVAVRVRLADFDKTPECVKINLISGNAEFLVVEFRERALLVWHTFEGLTRFVARIDGVESDRLTPYSIPKFRARSIGSKPLFLTDVRRETESASFRVSSSEPLTELEEYNLSKVGKILK